MSSDRLSAKQADRRRLSVAVVFLCFFLATMVVTLVRSTSTSDEARLGDDQAEITQPSLDEPDPGQPGLPVGADEPLQGTSSSALASNTHLVANGEQWTAAVAAAAPGDVIRLTATINTPLVYQGSNAGGSGGANGTASSPIIITADPGVWIDLGAYDTGNQAGLGIWHADHVHAVGLRIRNAQYGIRCLQCRGSESAPLRLANNTITDVGYVGIHVGGHLSTHAPSSHVLIESNSVTNTGRLTARYGEGIYLGHGITEWVDETSHITIRENEVAYTTAEAIDIKPGTREILVEGNLLHHVAPIDGGSISAHYVHSVPNPDPNTLDPVVIRNNRIWDQNLNGASGASDAAIWVGHGGVDIVDNVVWGFRNHYNTRAVRVQSPQAFGPHPITISNNVFWTQRGWVTWGSTATSSNVVASGNQGVDNASVEVVVDSSYFIGPVPPIGSGGEADSGTGPGSALTPVGEAPAPVPDAGPDENAGVPNPAPAPPANDPAPAPAADPVTAPTPAPDTGTASPPAVPAPKTPTNNEPARSPSPASPAPPPVEPGLPAGPQPSSPTGGGAAPAQPQLPSNPTTGASPTGSGSEVAGGEGVAAPLPVGDVWALIANEIERNPASAAQGVPWVDAAPRAGRPLPGGAWLSQPSDAPVAEVVGATGVEAQATLDSNQLSAAEVAATNGSDTRSGSFDRFRGSNGDSGTMLSSMLLACLAMCAIGLMLRAQKLDDTLPMNSSLRPLRLANR